MQIQSEIITNSDQQTITTLRADDTLSRLRNTRNVSAIQHGASSTADGWLTAFQQVWRVQREGLGICSTDKPPG
jgi:hypothetical protein